MQEQEIITLIRTHDKCGAEALLNHYGPLMRYIIAPILPNVQDREDCLSESVMRVWNNIDQYNPERGSWRTWLTAVTRNTALNCLRQNNKSSDMKELSPELHSPVQTPEEAVLLQEQREAVMRALNQLASSERTLFYRKYYYAQSTAQIASELGMTERAVEGRLHRMKKKLRKLLGGKAYE